MVSPQELKNKFKHIWIQEEDPLAEQLKFDCDKLLQETNSGSNDREKRLLALLGLQVLHLRENSISREECIYNRRSRIDWRSILIAAPGIIAAVTLILQLFNLLPSN